MGQNASAPAGDGSPHDEHARREFARLTDGTGRSYLTLHDLQQLSSSEAVDFSHLGTLFELNASRSGHVGLPELLAFARTCYERQRSCAPHEFKARLQAHCSLRMLREASASQASKDGVIDWFVLLLRETVTLKAATQAAAAKSAAGAARGAAGGPKKRRNAHRGSGGSSDGAVAATSAGTMGERRATDVEEEEEQEEEEEEEEEEDEEDEDGDEGDDPKTPRQGLELAELGVAADFVGLDSIEMLHQLFHIRRTHGIDFQTFLDMMQQVGEEMGKMDLVDKRYDDVVPVVVLRKFVADLLEGSIKLMGELTAEPEPTADGCVAERLSTQTNYSRAAEYAD